MVMAYVTTLASCKEDDLPKEDPATLSVSEEAIEFEAEGASSELLITCNTSWTIEESTDWLGLSASLGTGNTTVLLVAAANETTEARTTTLLISAEDSVVEVAITQKGQVEEAPIPVWELPGIEFAVAADNTDMRELTSVQLTAEMGIGWNVGNSLEATGGETAWGNPLISKQLIDAVKAAGFSAIRVPVAWSRFSDAEAYTIQQDWLERVEEVVNYALDNDMYVVINNHWDGGWMNDPVYEKEYYINDRLYTMWTQIATHFRDYDDRLLFAGSNEVLMEGNYGTPTREFYTVQNGFNQTFINAVRSTGGRNVYRHLVVQGFNTNIDHTVNFAVMPKDTVAQRMLMEVHYYDPYDFTLNENSNISQWGMNATDPEKTDSWGQEDWADTQFGRMKTNFVDKGYGVIIGEYGAISRTDEEGHDEYLRYYNEYVTNSMVENGLVPFYWDNGYSGNHGFALFNRATGEVIQPGVVEAIVSAGE